MDPIGIIDNGATPQSTVEVKPGVYTFGQGTLDIPYYLHNLGTNVQSYLASKNWGDQEKQAFQEAYNNYIAGLKDMQSNNSGRLRTDDFGTIYDTAGIINQDNNDFYIVPGEGMVQDINDLKRRDRKNAVPFNAYRELAAYANTVGQAIQAQKGSNATSVSDNIFDINKHGFQPYWISKLDPAGHGITDISPFLNLDPVDTSTNTRGRANRMAYLAQQLEEYKAQLPQYDFGKSSFKTNDIYLKRLDEAINGLKDGVYNDTDKLALMSIGLDPKVMGDFFTDQTNLSTTQEQNADAIAQDKFIKASKAQYDANRPRFNEDTPIDLNQLHIQNRSFEEINDVLFHNYKFKFPGLQTPEQNPEQVKRIYQQFAGSVLTALRAGQDTVNINGESKYMSQALPLALEMLQDEFQPVAGMPNLFYLDRPEDEAFGSVLVWDKARNKVFYTWAFNVENSSAYNIMKDSYTRQQGTANNNGLLAFRKEGGILKFDNGGGLFENTNFGAYGQSTIEHAMQRGISPEEQRLKDRQNGTDAETTALNPESTNWTASDYERLTGIGLDLASMFMTPGAGLITSVGGTAAHALADVSDPSVGGWQTLKNLGMSLGLDALAIVPGMESVKIAHGLKPFVPKLMKWVSTGMAAAGGMATIKNGNEILNSLQKLADNDPTTKMTVGDWQNIAQAVMGVTGVYNVGRGHYAYKQAKNAVTAKNQIGLGLVDNNGGTRNVIFKGDKANQVSQILGNKSLTFDQKKEQLNSLIKGLGKLKDPTGADIDYSKYSIGELDAPTTAGSMFGNARNFLKRKKNTDPNAAQETTGKDFDIFNVMDSSKMPKGGYWDDVSNIYHFDDTRTKSAKHIIEYGQGDIDSATEATLKGLFEGENAEFGELLRRAQVSTESRTAMRDGKGQEVIDKNLSKFRDLVSQKKNLQVQLGDLKNASASEKANLDAITKEIDTIEAELKKKFSKDLTDITNLDTKIDSLKSNIAREQKKASHAQDKSQIKAWQDEIDLAEKQIKAKTDKINKGFKVDTYDKQISDIEAKIKKLQENPDLILPKEASNDLETYLNLEAAIAKKQTSLANSSNETTKTRLNKEISQLTSERDALRANLNLDDGAVTQIKNIDQEISTLKKEQGVADQMDPAWIASHVADPTKSASLFVDRNGKLTKANGELYTAADAQIYGLKELRHADITAAVTKHKALISNQMSNLNGLRAKKAQIVANAKGIQNSHVDQINALTANKSHLETLRDSKTSQFEVGHLRDLQRQRITSEAKNQELLDQLTNGIGGRAWDVAERDLTNQIHAQNLHIKDLRAKLAKMQLPTTDPAYQYQNATQKLIDAINAKGTYDIVDSNGKIIQAAVPLKWEDIVAKYKLLGQGGTITKSKLLAKGGVLFAQKGTTVNHTTKGKGYSWNNNMGSTEEFADLLKSFDETNYQQFNDMQDSWYKNWTESNFKNNRNAGAQYQQDVYNRQGKYNTFQGANLNNAIERAIAGFDEHYNSQGIHDSDKQSDKHIGRRGTTGDYANKGYQDGYFSYMENLRHFGADLGNNDGGTVSQELIDRFNGILNQKNLRYYKGNNGMYYLGKLDQGTTEPTNPINPTNPIPTTKPTTPPIGIVDPGTNPLSGPVGIGKASPATSPYEAEGPTKLGKNDILNNLGKGTLTALQSPLASEAMRTAWLNAENRKQAKFTETPTYIDPMNFHRTIHGSLRDQQEGQAAQAKLMRMASQPLTADARLNTAARQDAWIKGQEFVNAGNTADEKAIRESSELSTAQEQKNMMSNHEAAMFNRQEGIGIRKNNLIRAKELQKSITDNNNALWSWNNQLRLNDWAEQRTAQKTYDRQRVAMDVQQHPEKYGLNVSDGYRRVFINKELTASELAEQDPIAYRQMVKDADNIEALQKNEVYAALGVNTRPLDFTQKSTFKTTGYTPTITTPGGPIGLAKNGGTITKAKIQAKIKTAELHQKRAEMESKSRDKDKDRTHKSMYVSPKKKRP